jgi:hypothetical protein
VKDFISLADYEDAADRAVALERKLTAHSHTRDPALKALEAQEFRLSAEACAALARANIKRCQEYAAQKLLASAQEEPPNANVSRRPLRAAWPDRKRRTSARTRDNFINKEMIT